MKALPVLFCSLLMLGTAAFAKETVVPEAGPLLQGLQKGLVLVRTAEDAGEAEGRAGAEAPHPLFKGLYSGAALGHAPRRLPGASYGLPEEGRLETHAGERRGVLLRPGHREKKGPGFHERRGIRDAEGPRAVPVEGLSDRRPGSERPWSGPARAK